MPQCVVLCGLEEVMHIGMHAAYTRAAAQWQFQCGAVLAPRSSVSSTPGALGA